MNKRFLACMAVCSSLIFCRVGAGDTQNSGTNVMKEIFSDEQHGEVPFTPVTPIGGNIQVLISLTPDSKTWQEIQSLRNLPRPKASHGNRPNQLSDQDQLEKLTEELKQATLANKDTSLQSSDSHLIKNNSDQVTK